MHIFEYVHPIHGSLMEGTSEVVQWEKLLATQAWSPIFNLQSPHKVRKKELTSQSRAQASTYTPQHTLSRQPHTQTQ